MKPRPPLRKPDKHRVYDIQYPEWNTYLKVDPGSTFFEVGLPAFGNGDWDTGPSSPACAQLACSVLNVPNPLPLGINCDRIVSAK